MWGTHTTSPNLSTATRLKASRDKTIPARHASFEDRPRNVFLTDRRLIDRDSENRSLMSLFDLKGCWHICASVQNIKRCIPGWFFFSTGFNETTRRCLYGSTRKTVQVEQPMTGLKVSKVFLVPVPTSMLTIRPIRIAIVVPPLCSEVELFQSYITNRGLQAQPWLISQFDRALNAPLCT